MSTPGSEPTDSQAVTQGAAPSSSAAGGGVVAAVQVALAGEHAAVWAYAVVTARAAGSAGTSRALADLGAHRLARDVLEDLLSARGASPVPAQPGYLVPALPAAALAVRVEERLATAYLDLVQVATDNALLAVGGNGVRDCAVRAARWRGASVPFPGR